jgi:hypothetical protein
LGGQLSNDLLEEGAYVQREPATFKEALAWLMKAQASTVIAL